MTREVPSVYILHGENLAEIDQFVKMLHSRLGETEVAMMNITRLDGRTCDFRELQANTQSVPFMTKRRIVELVHPLALVNNPDEVERFLKLLNQVPPSTALVLIEHKKLTPAKKRRKGDFNWVEEWADKNPGQAYIKLCLKPKGGAMIRWIIDQTETLGGQISHRAASELASMVGDDTHLTRNEIKKLLAYVNYGRTIEVEDVEHLTASIPQGDIFAMVDALTVQDGKRATQMLHKLFEVQDPISIFSMIVRQFRLLTIAREILDNDGGPADMIREFKVKPGVHPYVAEKTFNQARHFKLSELDTVYHRLLEIDESVKTGKIQNDLALDIFVTEFTSR